MFKQTERVPRRILVVEDEHDIAQLIALHLTDLPAEIVIAPDGPRGLDLALTQVWSAIVLDVRLPGMSGLDVCRAIRAQISWVPIIMLTARSTELDCVLGLELGADDYLTKPFSVLEMQARVKALLRRAEAKTSAEKNSTAAPKTIEHGALHIDFTQRRARIHGREIILAPREFDLLWYFAQHPGRVFNRSELLNDVWGYGHDGYDHTVNSHINRLRTKLSEESAQSQYIHTVWGVGYRFEVCA